MTTDERLAALEAKLDALTAPPSDYYTSRYSGEEIDAAIAAAGNPLILKKTYTSISAMNGDVSGEVATGEFAGIAPEDTADADYGKVYVKGASGWVYWATLKTIDGIKGPQGPAGPANVLTIGTVTKGSEAGAVITGTAPDQTLDLVLPQGDKGADAPVITGFTIRPEDYHMIVTLSDGSTYDAGYCRGASGSGTGDMEAAVYDPQGKRTDIFKFAADAIAAIPTPDVSGQIQTHNEDAAAHPAIRAEIAEKSGKALSFAVTLTAAGWSGNAQTVSNGNFAASGYAYTVAPAPGSFAAYASALIYADDVTAAGEMTFHCGEMPTEDLTVNILRSEAAA